MPHFAFNKELWDIGRKIEDQALPVLNKYYSCDFQRDENDIYDILDFKDENNKVVVEVKGRRIKSTQYAETIVTASKITEGFKMIDDGYKVFIVFIFTDKTFEYELKEDVSLQCKFTGTNCIKHYMIPVADLTEITDEKRQEHALAEEEDANDPEPEPEPE
tara:strand:- start:2398 stop:2880 length:483 start_codon:yes stop_codon:yes gene_type:complete